MAPTYPWEAERAAVYDPAAPMQSLAPGVQPMSQAPAAFREEAGIRAAVRQAAAANPMVGQSPAEQEQLVRVELARRSGGIPGQTPAVIPPDPVGGSRGATAEALGLGPGPVAADQGPAPGLSVADLSRLVNVGGTSSSTTQTRMGTPINPTIAAGLDKSLQAQGAAIQAEARAQAAASRERSFAMGLHQSQMEFRQEKHQAERAKQLAKIEEVDEEYKGLREEVKAARVDPDHFWKTRHPMQSIALILGAALSDIGRAMMGKGGGPNPVLQMVEAAIDRDVAAQKAEIAKKQDDLGAVRSVMGDMYRRLGDMDQAEQQTRMVIIDGLKTKLEAIGQASAGTELEAKARAGMAVLDQAGWQAKERAWIASQNQTVRSSTSSSQRAPLASLLGKANKGAAEAEGKRVSEATVKDLVDQVENLKQLQKLRGMYTRRHPTILGQLGSRVDAESKAYLDELEKSKIKYVRAEAGAAASDEERRAMGKTFAEGIGFTETFQSGLSKLDSHIRASAGKIRTTANLLRSAGYNVPSIAGTTPRGTAQ